jgi:hypothetical protein
METRRQGAGLLEVGVENMAGWSNRPTKGERLRNAETSLRKAIAAFRATAPSVAKAKSVRRLAARVLGFRLACLKQMRSLSTPHPTHLTRLKKPEAEMWAAGVSGILAEFSASDIGLMLNAPEDSPSSTLMSQIADAPNSPATPAPRPVDL